MSAFSRWRLRVSAVPQRFMAIAVILAGMPGQPSDVPGGLRNKTVLITGGTGGLGRASVEYFVARGDTVFTCGRSSTAVAELNAAASGVLPRVHATQVDLTDPAAITKWASEVKSVLGGRSLDVVINNAGVLKVGVPASNYDAKTFDMVMHTNVRGTAH